MLVRITNEPRDYAWGSASAIPDYLGTPTTGRPQAELWLGAHPGCPSRVDGRPLDEVLDDAGAPQPGMLLKVLAAASPLSLQAHPDAAQAAEGFAREDAAGLARDAPMRTYRDPHAKPELLVAVTRFEALSGFRPLERSLPVLDALTAIDERVAPFADRVRASLEDAVGWMLAGGDEPRSVVRAIVAAAERLPAALEPERDTVRRLEDASPGDPAIAIALLLHRLSLEPGEALFLAAGNLHAYLEGLGIELMGPSDNVLRGGLTPKHVDRDELLRILDFTPLDDPRLARVELPGATGWQPAAPFELRHVHGRHCASAAQAIVLAVAPLSIAAGGERLELARGEAAFVSVAGDLELEGDDAWAALSGAAEPTPRIAA